MGPAAEQGAQLRRRHLGVRRRLRAHPGRRRGGHLQLHLGGARELSGFRRDALSGQNYSLGRIVYYRRLTERSFLPLDFPLYLGGSIERGRIWNNDNEYDSGYINAASLMIGFDTPLGPLTFSYGINDENFKAFYLNLGQNF